MTVAFLALAIAGQEAAPSPAQLVSKMMSRYHGAKTLGGTIHTEIEIGDAKLTIDTVLWIERPSKLYLKQSTSPGMEFLVTADGREFSYDAPMRGIGDLSPRLLEYQGANDVGAVYATASMSLGERSTPLDLAISRKDDLAMLRDQWVTVEDGGSKELGGKPCRMVTGKWTSNPVYGQLGHYAMWITPEGDLLRFEVRGPNPEVQGQTITRLHTVDISVGATPPDGQFKVVR